MARRQRHRSKPKKKPNRYNPNEPDYRAVHSPLPALRLSRVGSMPVDLVTSAMALAASVMTRRRRR